MARLVVDAVVRPTGPGVGLVVAITGDDDGVPRSGLSPAAFTLMAIPPDDATSPQPCFVTDAMEGPPGVYRLSLDPLPPWAMTAPRRVIFSLAVRGEAEGGWADDLGHALVVATLP